MPDPTPPDPSIQLPDSYLTQPDWNLLIEAKVPTGLHVNWDLGNLVPNQDFQWNPMDEQHSKVLVLFPSKLVKAKGNKFEIGALVATDKNKIDMKYTTVTVGTAPVPPSPFTWPSWLTAGLVKTVGVILLCIAMLGAGVFVSSGVPGCIKPTPTPVPPIPPVPPVPPIPPGPPAPIPVAGLRVLIVFDKQDAAKLTAGQYAAIYGQVFRDNLEAKCVVGSDGKTKEWRIWDATTDPTNEAQVWKDAFKRPHPTLPWLLVSDGKSGFEGPLPASIEDTNKIIQKFGG